MTKVTKKGKQAGLRQTPTCAICFKRVQSDGFINQCEHTICMDCLESSRIHHLKDYQCKLCNVQMDHRKPRLTQAAN